MARGRGGVALLVALGWTGALQAAQLEPGTLHAWDEYVRGVSTRMAARAGDGPFLWMDEAPARLRAVRAGGIVVTPIPARNPVHVPDGLIHHWIGAAFVPNASVADVLSVVRDYGRYPEYYRPEVVASRALGRDGGEDRFTLVIRNHSLFSSHAMDGDYHGSFVRLDARRWYNITYTTRVQEIEDYGERSECRLPVGTGSGYIWRLFSVARFAERDGGVYVEVEAVALSRDIPGSLAWLVNPIVRRVARSSLETSLEQTRKAVDSTVLAGRKPGPRPMSWPVALRMGK